MTPTPSPTPKLGHEWSQIGEHVEAVAIHEKVSTKELSALSGIDSTTLSRYFNNRRPLKDKQLFRLGIALGIAIARRDTKKAQTCLAGRI